MMHHRRVRAQPEIDWEPIGIKPDATQPADAPSLLEAEALDIDVTGMSPRSLQYPCYDAPPGKERITARRLRKAAHVDGGHILMQIMGWSMGAGAQGRQVLWEGSATMIVAIVRLYDRPGDAADAVEALRQAGVPEHDVSVLTRDDPVSGAARGAEIGAVIGGVAGLAAALGLAIPGIGPVLATGWLAATAAGAAAGGLAGGALGLLSQAGLSREDAHEIAECLRRGATLVAARVPEADRGRYETILDVGAVDVRLRIAHYRQSGWTAFDPNAAPYVGKDS